MYSENDLGDLKLVWNNTLQTVIGFLSLLLHNPYASQHSVSAIHSNNRFHLIFIYLSNFIEIRILFRLEDTSPLTISWWSMAHVYNRKLICIMQTILWVRLNEYWTVWSLNWVTNVKKGISDFFPKPQNISHRLNTGDNIYSNTFRCPDAYMRDLVKILLLPCLI